MIGREEGNDGFPMATAAMKKRRIEEEEEEEEVVSSQIPDDKEGLLEFMDQRAKSIQRCKDQISILERKVLSFFFFFFILPKFGFYAVH